MERLHNQYGMCTKKGSDIYLEFIRLSADFLIKHEDKYDIIDLENIMLNGAAGAAAECRMRKSSDRRKVKKELDKKRIKSLPC